MEQDKAQVWIGRNKVGLMGLNAAFEEARSLGLQDEDVVVREILSRVRRNNYIPFGAEAEYGKALFREYRRFLGEPVEEESPGVTEILVLGPGCPRCDELERRVMVAVSELGIEADVHHVRDVKEIALYGLVGTPALVVNGAVKTVGTVPSVMEIKKILGEER